MSRDEKLVCAALEMAAKEADEAAKEDRLTGMGRWIAKRIRALDPAAIAASVPVGISAECRVDPNDPRLKEPMDAAYYHQRGEKYPAPPADGRDVEITRLRAELERVKKAYSGSALTNTVEGLNIFQWRFASMKEKQ